MESLKAPNAYSAALDGLKLTAGYSAAFDAMKLPTGYSAALDAMKLPTGYSAALDAMKLPTEYSAALDGLKTSEAMSRAIDSIKPPAALSAATEALSSPAYQQLVRALNTPVSQIAGAAMPTLPNNLLAALGAAPVLSLTRAPELRDLTEALDRMLRADATPKPRRRHTAADFFAAFEAEVSSFRELLRALSTMQQRNSHLSLVWRGQQDASWPVDSSLTRSLRDGDRQLGEDQMIAVERFQMAAAERWAATRSGGDLNFLAELQHEGAPTRLIDVSLDPEVAAWFAVQESARHEESDARLLAWGRSPAVKRNQQAESPATIPAAGGDTFWQFWPDKKARERNEWGTGRKVPSWQPAALNERMRAQRAAFLFDAEPIIGSDLLSLFNERFEDSWKADEIAKATRIVGFPSAHDRRATPNAAGIVPLFSLRIKASAKAEIRSYLERKGLVEETIYPDRAGLISYLRRMSAQFDVPRA